MRVLFVSGGNSKNFEIIPFIKAQGVAIQKQGVDVHYFPILGKGIIGYFRAGLMLRKHLKTNKYDIIHAHYTLAGWSAVIGSRKIPIVLSLMGSDAYGEYIGENRIKFASRYNIFLTYSIQPFVKKIISKSKNIEKFVFLKGRSVVIPNGVDLDLFRPVSKCAKVELGLSNKKKYILFLGDKTEVRKNFQLVKTATESIANSSIELVNPYPLPQTDLPKFMSAVDVLVLASFAEGSPNVIKEAMACNCSIVATDVGDVRWVIGPTDGCYVVGLNPEAFAEGIKKALAVGERTNGRERIVQLGLDSVTVAKKIIGIYQEVLSL